MEIPQPPMDEIRNLKSVECGEEAAKQFSFDNGFRNLNHGSFGTYPKLIRPILHHHQSRAEARPDTYIRYEYPLHLDASRQAIADYVHAPVDTCVFVPNATTGVNTVLRNLDYQPNDVIVYFATIYGSCEKLIHYITETTPAEARKVEYTYPISDTDLCAAFEATITAIRNDGKIPKLAIFDTIVSLPGVRMPFETLTALCRKHAIYSVIDAAHAIGHLPLDLTALDPDFFVSNCHKWLYTPRACALFYVPVRNQHLIRSTVPTSHGFVPKTQGINNPLPPSAKSAFVTNFEFVGTMDGSAYLTVPAALAWRSKVSWEGRRGEDAVMGYLLHLAQRAGEVVAGILGTEVLENEAGTLGRCGFANVRLPLPAVEVVGGERGREGEVGRWIERVCVAEYGTFVPVIFFGGAWWTRLSAQVYLREEDFVWGGEVLKEVCARVRRGEWKGEGGGAKL